MFKENLFSLKFIKLVIFVIKPNTLHPNVITATRNVNNLQSDENNFNIVTCIVSVRFYDKQYSKITLHVWRPNSVFCITFGVQALITGFKNEQSIWNEINQKQTDIITRFRNFNNEWPDGRTVKDLQAAYLLQRDRLRRHTRSYSTTTTLFTFRFNLIDARRVVGISRNRFDSIARRPDPKVKAVNVLFIGRNSRSRWGFRTVNTYAIALRRLWTMVNRLTINYRYRNSCRTREIRQSLWRDWSNVLRKASRKCPGTSPRSKPLMFSDVICRLKRTASFHRHVII